MWLHFFGETTNCNKKIRENYLITTGFNIYARASNKFVELISKCKSKFIIRKGKKIVNGSSSRSNDVGRSKGTEIKIVHWRKLSRRFI